jgi:hypothetical protein
MHQIKRGDANHWNGDAKYHQNYRVNLVMKWKGGLKVYCTFYTSDAGIFITRNVSINSETHGMLADTELLINPLYSTPEKNVI